MCKDAVDLLENSCNIVEASSKRYSISILGFEAGSGLIKTAATGTYKDKLKLTKGSSCNRFICAYSIFKCRFIVIKDVKQVY